MPYNLKRIKDFLIENEYSFSIVGPTASGKSGLAVELAKTLDGEIISLDSMQVYKGMDIGTGKITEPEMEGIEHYLIDIVPLTKKFSAGEFADMAKEKIGIIRNKGKIPVIVGGTGLYLRALLKGLFPTPSRSGVLRKRLEDWERREGLGAMHSFLKRIDPETADTVQPADRQRIFRSIEIFLVTVRTPAAHRRKYGFAEDRMNVIKIGLNFPSREMLYKVIEKRVDEMFEAGWVNEVESLLKEYSPGLHPFKAIGYREIVEYLNNECTLDDCIEEIKKSTRNYAKRQLTWFRKEEYLQWYDISKGKELVCMEVLKYIEDYYLNGS